jgi:hypothetical protein
MQALIFPFHARPFRRRLCRFLFILAYKSRFLSKFVNKKTMQKLVIQNADKIESAILSYSKNNEEADFIHRLHGVLLF